jgi:hypothetical protein
VGRRWSGGHARRPGPLHRVPKGEWMWERLVKECSLEYVFPNAPIKSEILGTIL